MTLQQINENLFIRQSMSQCEGCGYGFLSEELRYDLGDMLCADCSQNRMVAELDNAYTALQGDTRECVVCGGVFPMANDDVTITTDGIMCWACFSRLQEWEGN